MVNRTVILNHLKNLRSGGSEDHIIFSDTKDPDPERWNVEISSKYFLYNTKNKTYYAHQLFYDRDEGERMLSELNGVYFSSPWVLEEQRVVFSLKIRK